MVAVPSTETIVRTPSVCGGKPRIAGTRIRVQDVYIWHELWGRSVDEIVASFPQLSHASVHGALAYFFAHAEDIREDLADDARYAEEIPQQTGPGPLAMKQMAMPHFCRSRAHSISTNSFEGGPTIRVIFCWDLLSNSRFSTMKQSLSIPFLRQFVRRRGSLF